MGPTAVLFRCTSPLRRLQNPNPNFHFRSFSLLSWLRRSPDPSSPAAPENGGDTATARIGPAADISGDSVMDLDSIGEESSVWDYPISGVISVLDSCHDLTGLPWWMIISLSTLVIRTSLIPVLILQLKKGQEIAKLMPKLPPPFPPPLSGKSFADQYLLYRKKKKELGCPSYLWNFSLFAAQAPCFLLWMASIRRMCLENHPGFDNGGMLWFQNLTDFPQGILGCSFPLFVAGLHFVNVQISFQSIKLKDMGGTIGLLTKYYKKYLDILAIPLLFIGFNVPQGTLVYWVTNGLFTLCQQLSLKNPYVRMKLGLPDVKAPSGKGVPTEKVLTVMNSKMKEINTDTLAPQELVDLSLHLIASGHQEKALVMLRKAIEVDPELPSAFISIGQILFSQKSYEEAAKHYENAISKIQDREDTFLVVASFGAGLSHGSQGNLSEAIKHLKRIAELKEPDSPMDKACYYKGLVALASYLSQEGNNNEAAEYLKIVAAYDPNANVYLKQLEGS